MTASTTVKGLETSPATDSNSRAGIFAAVREVARPGIFDDPANINALDEVLDRLKVPRGAAGGGTPLKASAAGIELIQRFEGLARQLPDGRIAAYPDPATGGAPWTIGWGTTSDEDGRPIKPGDIWTKERAEARFRQHLAEFEEQLRAALAGTATTQHQFDAMLSLIYNVGAGPFRSSTLLKKHKARDYAGAVQEFGKWIYANKKVLNGLVARRAAEAALYRGGAGA